MMSGPPGTEIFISSDMFFLEVLLEPPSGLVRDVKIHHEGKSEQQVRIIDIIKCSLLNVFINFENCCFRVAKHSPRLCRVVISSISPRNWKDWRRSTN